MSTETIIWLIPLPPALAFFLIVLFTNRNKALSHTIAVGAALLSWLGSMIVFARALGVEHLGEHPFTSSINWLATGDTWFRIGVLVDPLTALTLFFVSWTVLMIFIYSIGYHNFGQPEGDHDHKGFPPHGATVEEHGHQRSDPVGKHVVPSVEPMYSRFFAFIGLFAFGMFTLVVSDNLLTLFVGWEIMGLCSYLLIGFWYGKKSARDAAVKAFMTTRIGDVFMLLGIAYLYSVTGTLSFREIFTESTLHTLQIIPSGALGFSTAGLIGLLLFIGTVGKSAQFPLHVWLPDAMEGPTPVSAMIHAATMVSAGVYTVIRMFPLLSLDAQTMSVVAFIGAFTALFAATIALAQNDIKRVLAYSTISQLGFMIAALGIGAYVAAVFHLITHAFFKALLFLGSGSVIHGMEHGAFHTGDHKVDPQDMFNMGGLKNKMPITFWTFLIGGFALSGFPIITAGFWSKDEILADAFARNLPVFITLAIAAFLTAFYTMRQITLTFLGEPRTEEAKRAHETPWTMTLPLLVLSVLAIGYGWVGIPENFPILGGLFPNWIHGFAGGTLAEHPEAGEFHLVPLLTSFVVALGGLGLGYLMYRNVNSSAEDKLQLGFLKNKYYVDEIYNAIFINPAIWFADKVVYQIMDKGFIDGILHLFGPGTQGIGDGIRNYFDLPFINRFLGDGSANATYFSGEKLRVIQTGRIQQYLMFALILFLAIGVILYVFVLN